MRVQFHFLRDVLPDRVTEIGPSPYDTANRYVYHYGDWWVTVDVPPMLLHKIPAEDRMATALIAHASRELCALLNRRWERP